MTAAEQEKRRKSSKRRLAGKVVDLPFFYYSAMNKFARIFAVLLVALAREPLPWDSSGGDGALPPALSTVRSL